MPVCDCGANGLLTASPAGTVDAPNGEGLLPPLVEPKGFGCTPPKAVANPPNPLALTAPPVASPAGATAAGGPAPLPPQ